MCVGAIMAYVDHTFSIRDDVSGGTFIVHSGPPVKEIALAVTLLALGTLGILFGVIMTVYKVGGDSGHGECCGFRVSVFFGCCFGVLRF